MADSTVLKNKVDMDLLFRGFEEVNKVVYVVTFHGGILIQRPWSQKVHPFVFIYVFYRSQ